MTPLSSVSTAIVMIVIPADFNVFATDNGSNKPVPFNAVAYTIITLERLYTRVGSQSDNRICFCVQWNWLGGSIFSLKHFEIQLIISLKLPQLQGLESKLII
ncbi:hypothetical protein GCK72_003269 [Caenorhabditis remanei]|uniref:Uncharacterized protein n=1 Tax=Caenorhabditis remanei TaxID=31234 RepID=A0A6A5HXY6_CAERE|nr:hypothetical protein GCK72_003269 [Caenorhabditis remanei]KAF1771443.1 hypothetical protein GCK72_003269 [Caenorhabditis remanei]